MNCSVGLRIILPDLAFEAPILFSAGTSLIVVVDGCYWPKAAGGRPDWLVDAIEPIADTANISVTARIYITTHNLNLMDMRRNLLHAAILVIGTVILVASLFADSIGIGSFPGFGFDQVIGSIVGSTLTAIGLLIVGLYFEINRR